MPTGLILILTSAFAFGVTVPTALVAVSPVVTTLPTPSIVTEPTPPVAARPVSGTLPVPVTVTESNPPVAARPVTPTSAAAAATTVPT